MVVKPAAAQGEFPPQERLLRLPQVLGLLGISRAKLYEMISVRSFPNPIKIGEAACWPESRVQAWILAKIAEADRAEAAPPPPRRKTAAPKPPADRREPSAPRPLTADETAKITVGIDTG